MAQLMLYTILSDRINIVVVGVDTVFHVIWRHDIMTVSYTPKLLARYIFLPYVQRMHPHSEGLTVLNHSFYRPAITRLSCVLG